MPYEVIEVSTDRKLAGPFEQPKDARTWASLWQGPRILVQIREIAIIERAHNG